MQAEYRAQSPASPPTLSQAQTHGKSGAGGTDLLCLLLCLLLWRLGGPGGRPGGPGSGPGGAPGCRMCTVLRCSGPKSVAALRSLVAASWVGVEPIAILKSTAGADSCGATSMRRVGAWCAACRCRKRRGGCGGLRWCLVQRAGGRAVQRGG